MFLNILPRIYKNPQVFINDNVNNLFQLRANIVTPWKWCRPRCVYERCEKYGL